MTKTHFNELGLFVIPIKFNSHLFTYNHYLDFLVDTEESGYTHVYIGEHLTDSREDIQSSLVFAAALLARTRKIKVCLSVLPLPHYNLPLLVKQLEDLYRLSEGRLMIGFSQGALASDFQYLNLDVTLRQSLFNDKLAELSRLVLSSPILDKLYPQAFFSTLLSPFPTKSNCLYRAGYGALSSNFCNPSYLHNHIKCLTADLSNGVQTPTPPFWNIALNLAPLHLMSPTSLEIVRNTLAYIYSKLQACGIESVMTGESPIGCDPNSVDLANFLQSQLVFPRIPPKVSQLAQLYPRHFGHYVVNLFDCFDDSCYSDFLLSLPFKGVDHASIC